MVHRISFIFLGAALALPHFIWAISGTEGTPLGGCGTGYVKFDAEQEILLQVKKFHHLRLQMPVNSQKTKVLHQDFISLSMIVHLLRHPLPWKMPNVLCIMQNLKISGIYVSRSMRSVLLSPMIHLLISNFLNLHLRVSKSLLQIIEMILLILLLQWNFPTNLQLEMYLYLGVICLEQYRLRTCIWNPARRKCIPDNSKQFYKCNLQCRIYRHIFNYGYAY